MTNAGQVWTETAKAKIIADETRKAAELRARVKKTIGSVPELIQEALRLGEDKITLWAPVTDSDTLLNNLRQLDKNIGKKDRELSSEDLQGGVREVAQWCENNDLIPLLHYENVPMVGDEWSLRARRKP